MAGTAKQETTDVKEVTKNAKGTILNPWTCLAVKNEKYAKECSEVYLCGKGANQISEEFRRFPSLEVLWFNHNRLTRLDNLESNFRVQEVYIAYNRLVSLKGLLTFKFLRVLLARGNQLRNLDKQINLLGNFSFLSRLDLSENAAADEPDYQLRIIYNLPQVEDLDRKAVKHHERIKAAEVVPSLDKVTEKPQAVGKRFEPSQQYSAMEKHCFKEASTLRQKYKRQEEEERQARYASSANWAQLYATGESQKDAKERYTSSMCNATDLSPYECSELYFFLLQRYVNNVEPQAIFKLTLDKTKEVGELMVGDYEKPKPDAWVDNGKPAGAGGTFDPPTAALKNAKAKGKDERGKMEARKLERSEVREIIDVLTGGDAVMLGRVLTDKCAEQHEDTGSGRIKAFTAVKADGAVTTWADETLSSFETLCILKSNKMQTGRVFTAVKTDGSGPAMPGVRASEFEEKGAREKVTFRLKAKLPDLKVEYDGEGRDPTDKEIIEQCLSMSKGKKEFEEKGVREKLKTKLGRDPTDAEVAEQCMSMYKARSVVTWGDPSSMPADQWNKLWEDKTTGVWKQVTAEDKAESSGVQLVVASAEGAFAALKDDGSVVTWGIAELSKDKKAQLSSGVKTVVVNDYAFAAVKADGSVVTWGDATCGGDSSGVAAQLSTGVKTVAGTADAFAAVKADGSTVTWGGSAREDARKRVFWKLLEAEDGTVSLYDFYKWATTLTWSWEDDDRLEARIADMAKRARMARLLSNHEDALVLSQMMNRMDGIKTRKRDLDFSSRNQKAEAVERRVDFLPIITFGKTTQVDQVSGKTRVEFVRAKSEFRFSACR
jgi:hypothetical protein